MSIVSGNAEKKFPSHTDIGMKVEAIVHGNAFFDKHQHNRETLDDLISDLNQNKLIIDQFTFWIIQD